VSDHQADYPIASMCRLLGVSSSGYYAWMKRRPSRRAETDATLLAEIHAAHATSRGTYGAPRIHADLTAKGIRVGRKRVARLMSQGGLAGVSRRKFVVTTVKGDGRQAPDLVERNFTTVAPDRLWVADITYIPTWSGFLYLAVVLDAFSRRVVGWSMATTLAAQLVLDALNMALVTRRPKDVIHHSDQGSQGGFNRLSQHDVCRSASETGHSPRIASLVKSVAPCSVSSRTSRRRAPVPQTASWTRPAHGALPEAGRLRGMVLLIPPRNAIWIWIRTNDIRSHGNIPS
jgi:putative transposase